jgi:hypothetical protein
LISKIPYPILFLEKTINFGCYHDEKGITTAAQMTNEHIKHRSEMRVHQYVGCQVFGKRIVYDYLIVSFDMNVHEHVRLPTVTLERKLK